MICNKWLRFSKLTLIFVKFPVWFGLWPITSTECWFAMISVLRKLFQAKLPVVFPFSLTFSKSSLLDFSVADVIMGLISPIYLSNILWLLDCVTMTWGSTVSVFFGSSYKQKNRIFSQATQNQSTTTVKNSMELTLALGACQRKSNWWCMTSVFNMRLGTWEAILIPVESPYWMLTTLSR